MFLLSVLEEVTPPGEIHKWATVSNVDAPAAIMNIEARD